ncbi:MAG: ATP-binding protein [Ilumatobacter sp.]|nr:ATP-binding protein [Ilumatobacter sp.]
MRTQPLPRDRHRRAIEGLLGTNPAVALLGARQVGKTTLARRIAETFVGPVHRFDLELPSDVARLDEPELALGPLDGLIVLDEIQRRPDLFPALRALIDQRTDRRFLILGSAAPELLRQTSESLAGRVAMYDLPPLALHEVGADSIDPLWIRGGFPRSFTAADDATSFRWRIDFIRTFIERDLPSLGSQVPSATTDRFWRMLSHVHGQVWNGARLAGSLGVAQSTIRRYLDLLTSALVVEQLRPWHENVGKRQVRSPKVYITDSGLLHALLDLPDRVAVERHPVLGASWEGFVLQQLAAATDSRPDQRYFWATHAGAELDLLVVRGNERVGFEVKRTATPKVTASLRSAIETLRLDRAFVVHAGMQSFPLPHGVEAVAAHELADRAF